MQAVSIILVKLNEESGEPERPAETTRSSSQLPLLLLSHLGCEACAVKTHGQDTTRRRPLENVTFCRRLLKLLLQNRMLWPRIAFGTAAVGLLAALSASRKS